MGVRMGDGLWGPDPIFRVVSFEREQDPRVVKTRGLFKAVVYYHEVPFMA